MIAIGRYFVFVVLMTETILSAPSFSKQEQDQFLKKILKLHNEYRAKHGVGDLKWNAKLTESAKNILNKLINKKLNNLHENEGVNMGFAELKDDSKLDDDEAKNLFFKWYNTRVGYDYNNEPSNVNADAFTQIVWRLTTDVGLAMEVNKNGYYDVVVTYLPKGNKKNQYRNNVSRCEKQ